MEPLLKLRAAAAEGIHILRFGEDSLPEGDLQKAVFMNKGDRITLKVSASKATDLYLAGYRGGVYEEGRWMPLKRSSFGEDREGMLRWLQGQQFDIYSQYNSYLTTGGEKGETDRVTIENVGADRSYVYLPYGTEPMKLSWSGLKQDGSYRSFALSGCHRYHFNSNPAGLPGELLHVSSWMLDPDGEQEGYVQSEAVYRDFVYDNYLLVDPSLETLIRSRFCQNPQEMETGGIYAVTQRIRSVLEETVVYEEIPEGLIGEQEDPIRWFLTKGRRGNAALYASAAVEAFRAFGIPARYAEGYLLRESRITASAGAVAALTAADSHAWAEVYMDGIGWLPIDVTPGFYYDTYALMKLVQQPQDTKQMSASEDGENPADEIQTDVGGSREAEEEEQLLEERTRLLIGIAVFLAALSLLALLLLEMIRLIRRRRFFYRYKQRTEEEQDRLLCEGIERMMKLSGILLCLGWQMEETKASFQQAFPAFDSDEFQRVSRLMEQTLFGGKCLLPHEKRVLSGFLHKALEGKNRLRLFAKLRLRYFF